MLILSFILSWEVSEWSKCDLNCTGVRTRTVTCLLTFDGHTIVVSGEELEGEQIYIFYHQVDEEECHTRKPVSQQICTPNSCDSWESGPWSSV